MSKQRECQWRREIKKTKSELAIEDRRRKEQIKKKRLEETWTKKNELLGKRKELRKKMKEREEKKEREMVENRRKRVAVQKKRKLKEELYKDAN